MSAGHRHGDERAASALADEYYDRTKALVDACEVVASYDVPWLANRSTDGKRVYRDKRVPKVLPTTGIDTDKTLPWHELGEWAAENDGYSYDDAHTKVANPLERKAVEAQKPDDANIWGAYSEEMDGYIREVDDESIENVPPDIDLRPFKDDDRKLLQELIAAGADSKSATASLPGLTRQSIHLRKKEMDARVKPAHDAESARTSLRATMPQILKPQDVITRLNAGEKPEQIFLADDGGYKAKLVGPEAEITLTAEDRTLDFHHLDRRDRPLRRQHQARRLEDRELQAQSLGAVGAR
jgi:hypothetical protein